MKFPPLKVALYLYKSSIRPYMEYGCHVWAVAPMCYLNMLDNLQKGVCPSLDASLETLAHRRNVTILSLLYGYYFWRFSS